MKPSLSLLLPFSLLPLLHAVNIPITKRAAAPKTIGASFYKGTVNAATADDEEGIATDADLVYIANIDIAGTEIPVQIDTGSSDLWVKPNTTLSSVTQSTILINMTYGIGYTAGLVARADVQFADYDLPSQAFILATDASNPIFSYGAQGIVGLGFTSLSQIDRSVNETGASWGRSLLYNAFAQKAASPNFISFVLQRSQDPSDAVQGSLTIGEYVPDYDAIQSVVALPTVPAVNPSRWTVALDAIETGSGNMTSFTSVSVNAPAGKAVVLIDSGTSYAYVTTAVAQAIYGSIPGAVLDTSAQQWTLPCDAQVTLAFWFGGQRIYVHPLDSNRMSADNTCFGTFLPQSLSVGGSDYDLLLGDVFLRNAYSLYDFGDTDGSGNPTTGPYVKLLSITSELEALQDFVSIRGGTVPASVAQSTDTASGSGATDLPQSSPVVSTEDQMNMSITKILDYIPALLGILALNTVFLIALLIVGIVLCMRWRKGKGKAGNVRNAGGKQTYKPVQLETGTNDDAFDPAALYSQHAQDEEKDLGTGGGGGGGLDPPRLPFDPRHSVFNPRLSLIRANMSQTSIEKISAEEEKPAPVSPVSAGGTTLVSRSATENKRFSTMQPSVMTIDEHPGSGSFEESYSSGSTGVDAAALLTPPAGDRDSFLAPPTLPFNADNNTNRLSIAGLPPLPPSRPGSMIVPSASDPVVSTPTPDRRLSTMSTLQPPMAPFAAGRPRQERSPSPSSHHSASPPTALITLETPEKQQSTLEPPNAAYSQGHGHGRNDSLSQLPPLPMSRPGSMLVPSASEPLAMDSRRMSRIDPPAATYAEGRRGSVDRSPSPSSSPTNANAPYPSSLMADQDSPSSRRQSTLQAPGLPAARPAPNRPPPPRPLSLVDAGAAGPPRARMLSPRIAESRPASMFDTSPQLAMPPASLRGSRLARASYVPPPSNSMSMAQDNLATRAARFQLQDGPSPSLNPSQAGASESSHTFPAGLRAGQAGARGGSRLARSSFVPGRMGDQPGMGDGLAQVDLQSYSNNNNNNNRATMLLPPLPPSRPGSYYDPSQAPSYGRAEEDLTDVFNAGHAGQHQRHGSGSGAHTMGGDGGDLVDFFHPRSDES